MLKRQKEGGKKKHRQSFTMMGRLHKPHHREGDGETHRTLP
jgi:hypothetical protein